MSALRLVMIDAQTHTSRAEIIRQRFRRCAVSCPGEEPSILRLSMGLIPFSFSSLSSAGNLVTNAMSTFSSEGLHGLLDGVGAECPVPSFAVADVQNSPMDIYLSYLADVLAKHTDCEPQVAYDSIQGPDEFCDLVVVVPRLRLEAINPAELALNLNRNVRSLALYIGPESVFLTSTMETSSQERLFLSNRSPMESIFGLYSPPILLPVYFCLTSLIVGFHTVQPL